MGGPLRHPATAVSLVLLLSLSLHCSDDRAPLGARCSSGTQCASGLCLEGDAGAVCVSRCALDSECAASQVCGRFDFRGRDDAGVPAGKESDVVRVCRPPIQARCEGACGGAGGLCVGEADRVCVPRCVDRVDCGGRDCVSDGCGPAHCAPACDSLRDCPRFFVCDTAFLGTDGHGRCLPVAEADAGADAGVDAVCADGG